MDKSDLRIVFFGTPEFAVASLDRLVSEGFDVAAVVTMPDKIAGRGHKLLESDVKKNAVAKGLPVLQPEKLKSPEFIDQLRNINADLFIVIAFRMLPEAVWAMPRLGTFNLHGSLLPKYRGAAPINRAIMNGETETGITTFFLKHDMVGRTVNSILDGSLSTRPQPEGEFIAAPKIFKEDCRIDWTRDAVTVHNQVRGLSPYPAAFTTFEDKEGRRFDARISSRPSPAATPETPCQAKSLSTGRGCISAPPILRSRSCRCSRPARSVWAHRRSCSAIILSKPCSDGR